MKNTNDNQNIDTFNQELLGFIQGGLLKSMGYSSKDARKKRIVIVNSWSEQSCAHTHLRELSAAVKYGVTAAGGLPLEINVIGPCGSFGEDSDKIAHYDFPTRDAITASIEAALNQFWCDGWIGIGSCDKIVPAMVIAALRFNRPFLFIPGGTQIPGTHNGQWYSVLSGAKTYFNKMLDGPISEEEYEGMTSACGNCAGTCSELSTGSSMQIITEAMGIALPYASTSAGASSEIKSLASEAGSTIMRLAEQEIRPRDIITKESMENAIRVNLAICGSTNTVIHMAAFAHEAEIDVTLDTWDAAAKSNLKPIAAISPSGPYSVYDLHHAGGVPAVMKQIKDFLHLDSVSVIGKTAEEIIASAHVNNSAVIHDIANPILDFCSIKVIRGNLAPRGAISRLSVVEDGQALAGRYSAIVFDKYTDALSAVLDGKIKSGDVIVLRYEGPRGGPAMSEMFFIVYAIKKMGLKRIALITDGRFSGATSGMIAIGHVCPEAYVGGPIALIKDGDMLNIDLPNGVLDIELSDEELEERRKAWTVPEKKFTKGLLAVYRKMALQADEGAGWALE